MEISQIALVALSAIAFFLGLFWGMIYDLLRAIGNTSQLLTRTNQLPTFKALQSFYARKGKRKRFRFKSVLRFLADFLFCICTAISVILLFYQGNNGKMRFPVLLCILLGALLYRALFSRAVLAVWTFLLAFFIWIVRLIFFALMAPLMWLLKKIVSQIRCKLLAFRLQREKKNREKYTRNLFYTLEKTVSEMHGENHMNERKRNGKSKEKTI